MASGHLISLEAPALPSLEAFRGLKSRVLLSVGSSAGVGSYSLDRRVGGFGFRRFGLLVFCDLDWGLDVSGVLHIWA